LFDFGGVFPLEALRETISDVDDFEVDVFGGGGTGKYFVDIFEEGVGIEFVPKHIFDNGDGRTL
jgi:hypothetical protein